MNKSESNHINFRSTSDGWRGRLADDFTFQSVWLLGQAISKYICNDLKSREIVVGYDTRFMSKEFAKYLADVFVYNGISVDLFSGPCPTPLLTFATVSRGSKIGLTVTASHNPIYDDGLKVRMGYGGAPSTEIVKGIEKYFIGSQKNIASDAVGVVKIIDPTRDYVERIRKLVGFSSLDEPITVIVDTMHGTSHGYLRKIVSGTNFKVVYINSNLDPRFGGFPPEPKYETTQKLQKLIVDQGCGLGIAHDGDGDRMVAVSPGRGYLSPHDVSAIILWYLISVKKMSGKVVGTSTLGRKVRLLCQHFGLDFQEVPVGFKNATEIMLREKVLMAAEENGGIGFGFYLPERDAILAAAILCKVESSFAGGVDRVLNEIEKITGKSGFCRHNYVPSVEGWELMVYVENLNWDTLAYLPIKDVSWLDGVKIVFINNDWVSIRSSGTEDVIRIYAESKSRVDAEKMVNLIRNLFIKFETKE